MSGRWFRRKLRQVGEGALGRHGIHRPTVAWLILIEFEQLPVNARRTPQRIGVAHAADQITDFWTDPGPSRTTGSQATSLSSSAARLRKRKTKIDTTAKRIVTMTVTVRPARQNHQPLSALWRF